MATINSHELAALFSTALGFCLKVLREDFGLIALEFMPPSGILQLADQTGTPQPLFLTPDFAIGRTTILSRHWQRQDPDFFAQHIHHADTNFALVDVGANIGLFTRQLLSLARNRIPAIWCYEPDPGNFELLRRNIAFVQGIDLRQAALSSSQLTATLFKDPDNAGNYSLAASAMPRAGCISIAVPTVSALSQEKEWLSSGMPILYKSDTQGCDMMIASSLSNTFWREVSCAMLELWSLPGVDYDVSAFADVLDCFPRKAFSDQRSNSVGTTDVIRFLKENGREGKDLYLWR